MLDLWRISKHRDLTGEGGRRASARWHHAGKPVVYLAESAPGALLEMLVHLELDPNSLPPNYTLLRVSAASAVKILELDLQGDAWRSDIEASRNVGDKWLAEGRSALARVPSILMPNTWNVLLNPSHPDESMVEIADIQTAAFDPRLLRARGLERGELRPFKGHSVRS